MNTKFRGAGLTDTRSSFARAIPGSIVALVLLGMLAGCGNSSSVTAREGVQVEIVPGPNYRHEFPLFWFFSLRNPPQMVLWSETLDGEFLETVMVTRKLGTDHWSRAPGDDTAGDALSRPSAAPVWSHRSGRAVSAGAGDEVRAGNADLDAVTRATPKRGPALEASIPALSAERFYLYLEVNHSTDFNDAYPANGRPGEPGYSGGPYGSGQPSLLYRAYVSLLNPEESDTQFYLIGHGSPDGSDGEVTGKLDGISTALEIIDEVRLQVDQAGG
jgi:hypothetical protein